MALTKSYGSKPTVRCYPQSEVSWNSAEKAFRAFLDRPRKHACPLYRSTGGGTGEFYDGARRLYPAGCLKRGKVTHLDVEYALTLRKDGTVESAELVSAADSDVAPERREAVLKCLADDIGKVIFEFHDGKIAISHRLSL